MDSDRIEGAADNVAGKVQGAVGDLTGDTKTQVEGKARELGGKAQNAYGSAKDALGDAGESVQDTLAYLRDKVESIAASLGGGNISDTGRQALNTVEDQVHENPIAALLVAVGVGYVIGFLTTRR